MFIQEQKERIVSTLKLIDHLFNNMPLLRFAVDEESFKNSLFSPRIVGNRLVLYRQVASFLESIADSLKSNALKTALNQVKTSWYNTQSGEFKAADINQQVKQVNTIGLIYRNIIQESSANEFKPLSVNIQKNLDKSCLFGNIAQYRYSLGWRLIQEKSSGFNLVPNSSLQNSIRALFKEKYVLRIAKRFQIYHKKRLQIWWHDLNQLNYKSPHWQTLIPLYRDLDVLKSWLKNLTNAQQNIDQRQNGTLEYAMTVQKYLSYYKVAYFKKKFSSQSPSRITNELAILFAKKNWCYPEVESHILKNKFLIQKKIREYSNTILRPISCSTRFFAHLLLGITNHAAYQIGYKISQVAIDSLDQASQTLNEIVLSDVQKNQVGHISGASCLLIEFSFASWIQTPYALINLTSQTLVRQMDVWLAPGSFLEPYYARYWNSYNFINYESHLRWITGLFVHLLSSEIFTGLGLIRFIPLSARGISYASATAAVELIKYLSKKFISPSTRQNWALAEAMVSMMGYRYGFTLGYQLYENSYLCKEISFIESINRFGWKTAFDQKALKKSYRFFATHFHPDKGGNEKEMAKINLAYECLQRYAG